MGDGRTGAEGLLEPGATPRARGWPPTLPSGGRGPVCLGDAPRPGFHGNRFTRPQRPLVGRPRGSTSWIRREVTAGPSRSGDWTCLWGPGTRCRATSPQGRGLPPRPVLLGLSPQRGQDGGEGSSGRVREGSTPDPGPTAQRCRATGGGSLPSAWRGQRARPWAERARKDTLLSAQRPTAGPTGSSPHPGYGTPLSAQPGARPGPTPPDTWGQRGAGPGPTSQRCNGSSPRP